MPRQKSGTDGDGKDTDEGMYDGGSLLRRGEAYDALEENTREYIKMLEEVEELVEANMLDNDNEDETE